MKKMKKVAILLAVIIILSSVCIMPVSAVTCNQSETWANYYTCIDQACDGWKIWADSYYHTWIIRTWDCSTASWDYEDLSHWESCC